MPQGRDSRPVLVRFGSAPAAPDQPRAANGAVCRDSTWILPVSILTDRPQDRLAVGERPVAWQESLRTAIRNGDDLLRLLGLSRADVAFSALPEAQFPVFAPAEWIARIRPGDPHDPLLRQILPLDAENHSVDGFSDDPLEENESSNTPGLLRKYNGRALMITTGRCAIHCRYCFRRHFPYDAVSPPTDAWNAAIAEIHRDTQLCEVILSGGDPLTVVDQSLSRLAARLAEVPHLRRLRLHTRLPIVIPQRVDQHLLAWLGNCQLRPIVVVHANHPAEIDNHVAAALRRLVDRGVTVLNQAVLLRDVNDNADVQCQLCERLVDLGVMPYYLHQMDRVAGAAHFEVAPERGLEIIDALRKRLPGYAVPRFAQEVPGEPSKRILA